VGVVTGEEKSGRVLPKEELSDDAVQFLKQFNKE